jgi:hypothetical protein
MAIAGPPEPGDGPERKRYAITGDGVTEVNTWLETPSAPEPHLQTVLFAKVVLSLMLDRPADRYLDLQRGDLQQCAGSPSSNSTVAWSTPARRPWAVPPEADLRWIDHTAARLSALAREVRR